MPLHAVDYAFFAILTLSSLALGLYYTAWKKRKTATPSNRKWPTSGCLRLQHEEVFLASRSIPSWTLALSLLASVATGVGVVSHSAHQYAYGFNFAWSVASIVMATPCVVYIFLPVLYELKVTSVFQGGLRGVVWADCVQGIVLFAAPFVVVGKILYDSAHLEVPLRPLSDLDAKKWFLRFEVDASSDETAWAYALGSVPFNLVRQGLDQMVAQRFLAAGSMQSARRSVPTFFA
ncbi:hypothetical protein HPB50_020103 [Hyalomma asiaticum]|uniref:Uncharacterized protein n=1 Tax=Hyalomma asiaticum TaxID=266040 RepID=A0ACB7RKI9_HYAAI|nr:hypothetical protein HPB50_020103 [Hyalomma asiaticum]